MVVTEGQNTQAWVTAIGRQKFATLTKRLEVDAVRHARLGQLRGGGASHSLSAPATLSVRVDPHRTSRLMY
jgi:hypothetical protein